MIDPHEVLVTPARCALAVSLLLAACGSGGERGAIARSTQPIEPTVRDSVGVTIYELPADALERAPLVTMDSMPLAVIGDSTPDGDVSMMYPPMLYPHGRSAGFDARAFTMRVFAKDGSPLTRIGRRGEGPGEFKGPQGFVLTNGDSLVVSDLLASRAMVIGPDLEVLGSFPARFSFREAQYAIRGRFPDGSWLLAPASFGRNMEFADRDEPQPPIAVLRQRDSAGTPLVDTIGQVRRPRVVTAESDHGLMALEPEFSATEAALLWDSVLAVLGHERWEVVTRSADGRLRSVYRLPIARRSVTKAMRDTITASRRKAYSELGGGGDGRDRVTRFPDIPFADSMAPFETRRSWTTHGGKLWLTGLISPLDSVVGHTALDNHGRILGRLIVSKSIEIVGLSDDLALVRTRTADDELRYELHQLHFAAASP